MKTMRKTNSQTWTKLVEIKTKARTIKGICNAINKFYGEEFYEPDQIEKCIKDGWIEVCSDGVVLFADLG